MRHIHDKQQQGSPDGPDGSRQEIDQQVEKLEEDELQYVQSAEDLVKCVSLLLVSLVVYMYAFFSQ